MAYSTEDSAWKLTAAQEAEVAKMNSVSEIQMAMERFAMEQHLYGRDPLDPSSRIEQPRANIPANTPMAKVININGVKHYVSGADEGELVKNELAVMRQIFSSAPVAAEEQPRNERGQFTPRPDVDPAAAALAPSVVAALEAAGIDPDALRELSESKSTARDTQSWELAAEEFRNGVGSSWVGGQTNKTTMGKVIQILGLADQPTVETLTKAYQYMKENGLMAANEELEREKKISEANSYEDIKRSVGYRGDGFGGGSGIFGR